MSQNRVSIFDTTLRDGEQSPGCSMNLREKVRMAMKLQDLGVDIIEAGFPIASEGEYAAVRAVAAQCRKVKVAALCRTAEQDVARAAEALKDAAHPRIHTFCATSDIHLEHKLKKSRSEVIDMTRAAVRQVLSRRCDAQRYRLPLRSARSGSRCGRLSAQRSGHCRLHDANGVHAPGPTSARKSRQRPRCDHQRSLPQRSRPRCRKQSRRDRSRSTSG